MLMKETWQSVCESSFSDAVAEIMPKYDNILIVGDFIIHVCWLTKQLVKEIF